MVSIPLQPLLPIPSNLQDDRTEIVYLSKMEPIEMFAKAYTESENEIYCTKIYLSQNVIYHTVHEIVKVRQRYIQRELTPESYLLTLLATDRCVGTNNIERHISVK